MKKYLTMLFAILSVLPVVAQEVLHLNNGATITIQNGVEVSLQGGIGLENGSILTNNGIVRLKNNQSANTSEWRDNSAAGALAGAGLVIFNSNNPQNFFGSTNFFAVQMNSANLVLNDNLKISDHLEFINGKISTGKFYAFINNAAASSLINDLSNAGYVNSWVNGNLRRLVAVNTTTYDFPVGNGTRSNLLKFINNNVSGPTYLTASFGPKPGTDNGINATENLTHYNAINNGGVWYLIPDVSLSAGNYALQLYFNGFTGLNDNQFGLLRRPDASTNGVDWIVPAGSQLESNNGTGRKVSDGFARRFNISSFSQWGVGILDNVPCVNCLPACTYTRDFYGNKNSSGCYNNGGTPLTSSQLMLNAFGATTSKLFGNAANRRFFTLLKSDISNGNVFKMLQSNKMVDGNASAQPLGVDDALPFNGATYSDQSTWYLVPIPTSGSQKGKINNQLLAQLIVLWFNIQTSSALGTVDLTNDTLITVKQTACGSRVASGNPSKFGISHNVIAYLNGGNGYSNSVNGLFQLANDILGGGNSSISAPDVLNGVVSINNAFDGCRIQTGSIASTPLMYTVATQRREPELSVPDKLLATAFPNPYQKQFSLQITTPVGGIALIEYFDINGAKIYEQKKFIANKVNNIVPYSGPIRAGVLIYKIKLANYNAGGFVVNPN